MRKITLTVVVLLGLTVVAVGAVGLLFGERILLNLMQRQVAENLSGAGLDDFPEGLNLVLCGAGSPLPDLKRAGPCVAVIAGSRIFVVDVGSGSSRNLTLSGIPIGRVEALLLTHFHSDHIDGFGELMLQRWAGGGRSDPLPVIGPQGVAQVVAGFNLAYRADFGYRVAHHGPEVIPPRGAGAQARPFTAPAEGEGLVLVDSAGLRITTFTVAHPPIEPAVAYRFDYQGRSLVISGDTLPSATLQKWSQGVDLLVHEALAEHMVARMIAGAREAGATHVEKISEDILDYHTTPVQAAQIAAAAKVRHLLFYHIVPPLPLPPLERVFVRGVADVYGGEFTVGRDRTWVSLPAQSTTVNVSQRGQFR